MKMINYLRLGVVAIIMSGVLLLAIEVYFVVTNSNRPEFWPDDVDAPYQEMSSGLFSGYVHEENPDHEKMKAKGSVLCDFDLDGDLDLYFGYAIVVGDIDNNGYPDILKWRFMAEVSYNDDCEEYDFQTVCEEDENCYWEENNCWNDASPQFSPHVMLLNDGNNTFLTHDFLPSQELPYLHSLGLMDADLDGDLDLLAIQEENDNQFLL